MTINERVSAERLDTIKSWRETYGQDANVMIPASEAESIISELQQYRAAAEPVAWQWFHLNQWHVTNDEERARELAWDGVKVVPLYAAPRPSELLKIIERLSASGYKYNDGPVDETNAGAVVGIVLQQLADAVAQCDAAPQVTSVPEEVPESLKDRLLTICDLVEDNDEYCQDIWNACRATMLHGDK